MLLVILVELITQSVDNKMIDSVESQRKTIWQLQVRVMGGHSDETFWKRKTTACGAFSPAAHSTCRSHAAGCPKGACCGHETGRN
jgi:hypothetical protein